MLGVAKFDSKNGDSDDSRAEGQQEDEDDNRLGRCLPPSITETEQWLLIHGEG